MLTKKLFLASLTLVLTTPALAMLCPNNFSEINIGDSLETVKSVCGAPDSEKASDTQANVPQEWSYYVQVDPNNPATVKMTIAFTNGKATNMSVNGISIGSTAICAGNNIAVGATMETVKTACGKPGFINQGNVSASQAAATKVTDLTYGNTTLEFENGVLKGKQ